MKCCYKRTALSALSVFLFLSHHTAFASNSLKWLKPERLGTLYTVADANNQDDVDQFELFGTFSSPWHWGQKWKASIEFQAGAGRYELSGDKIHYLSIGPSVRIKYSDWPISLDLGTRPTLLSDSETPKIDVGGRFHFTSHAALTYHFDAPVDIGFRYHHMSNAGTNKDNPGLDVFMVELAYRF